MWPSLGKQEEINMEKFDDSGPRYMDWSGRPVLVFDGTYGWNDVLGRWSDISRDPCADAMFQHAYDKGEVQEISRSDFVRRFSRASAQLDNLEPEPGLAAQFDEIMKLGTKGRWPAARKDYWGIPDLGVNVPNLPDYDQVPIPGPLMFGPGTCTNYVSSVRMMAEYNAARRRLKGLRVGAWVMSPRTTYRWANWRSGNVYWVPKQIALPEELEIKVENVDD
jgi:hypothetical protein